MQADLDYLISIFESIELYSNEKKTKYMIVRGAAASKALWAEVYSNFNARKLEEYVYYYLCT